MIPVNRDTLMMIATIVCAVGIIFLFKELNKTKEEMNLQELFGSGRQASEALEPAPEPEKKEKTEDDDKSEE